MPLYRSVIGNRLPSDCPELPDIMTSPERRCSSRTFRYGYLVTT